MAFRRRFWQSAVMLTIVRKTNTRVSTKTASADEDKQLPGLLTEDEQVRRCRSGKSATPFGAGSLWEETRSRDGEREGLSNALPALSRLSAVRFPEPAAGGRHGPCRAERAAAAWLNGLRGRDRRNNSAPPAAAAAGIPAIRPAFQLQSLRLPGGALTPRLARRTAPRRGSPPRPPRRS